MTTEVTVLDRVMYADTVAADLLRMPVTTLRYWLEGDARRDRSPILRRESTGGRQVTWAEFVEAGLLRSYRTDKRVPMRALRTFIEILRDERGVPYPLAHKEPLVSGRDLVLHAQERAALDPHYWLVTRQGDQLMLTAATDRFLERVSWSSGDDPFVATWRPHDDPASAVRLDPEVRFGQAQVAGVSTEALWAEYATEATPREIAESFDLDEADVWDALQYERLLRLERRPAG